MGVISFASLKGGVGKTTLSLNVAGAFAERGCQTLLIDLDPTAHASRFFSASTARSARKQPSLPTESPLARLFLRAEPSIPGLERGSLIEAAEAASIELAVQVRNELSILPAGPELRHFLWGKGARIFRRQFSNLVSELCSQYDHVVIDTPPDYNVLTRNAIAVSDQVVVPVDSSAMSIDSLEDIINSSAHIQGPTWCVARTMVNRQASRIQKLSNDRLQANLSLHDSSDADCADELPIEDERQFMSLLRSRSGERDSGRHYENGSSGHSSLFDFHDDDEESPPPLAAVKNGAPAPGAVDTSPIFLLNSLIYRTEEQNRLTFVGQTAYDSRATAKLAKQYTAVARELEGLLALGHPDEPEIEFGSLFGSSREPAYP